MEIVVAETVNIVQLTEELCAAVPAAFLADVGGRRTAVGRVFGDVGGTVEDGLYAGATIEVPDGSDEAAIHAVIAAHKPGARAVETAIAAPTVEEKLAGALEALPDGPVSKKDLADVIATLRGTNDA